MLNNPLVTIGITAYNAADTIGRAIRSALAQSWQPIEIVVVDDCSTDDTNDVLLQLSVVHPELRIFCNQNNGGVAVSRNRIITEAKGEFVAFFDDDDESLPERITTQLWRILTYERDFANEAPVICHTARTLSYPGGVERVESTMGERERRCAPHNMEVAERILLGTFVEDGYGACPTCSQMARLSTYQDVGGFDPAFRRSEDTELNVRLAKAGAHFIGVAKPMVLQTMTKTNDKSLADECRFAQMLLEKHRDIADKYDMFDFCRRWIDIKFAWLEGRKFDFVRGFLSQSLKHPKFVYLRFSSALPNIGLNRAFSRFYQRNEG